MDSFKRSHPSQPPALSNCHPLRLLPMPFKRLLSSLIPSSSQPLTTAQALSQQLRANPLMRFETLADLQAAAALGIRIDVAQATQDDWLRLPGLSIHQARTLAQLGQSGLQFHCLDDIAAALGLSINQVAGYGPILQFCFYDEDERSPICNANHASAAALQTLPVLSESLVTAILQERNSRGPFSDLANFQQRLSLDAATTSQLMHYLRF